MSSNQNSFHRKDSIYIEGSYLVRAKVPSDPEEPEYQKTFNKQELSKLTKSWHQDQKMNIIPPVYQDNDAEFDEGLEARIKSEAIKKEAFYKKNSRMKGQREERDDGWSSWANQAQNGEDGSGSFFKTSPTKKAKKNASEVNREVRLKVGGPLGARNRRNTQNGKVGSFWGGSQNPLAEKLESGRRAPEGAWGHTKTSQKRPGGSSIPKKAQKSKIGENWEMEETNELSHSPGSQSGKCDEEDPNGDDWIASIKADIHPKTQTKRSPKKGLKALKSLKTDKNKQEGFKTGQHLAKRSQPTPNGFSDSSDSSDTDDSFIDDGDTGFGAGMDKVDARTIREAVADQVYKDLDKPSQRKLKKAGKVQRPDVEDFVDYTDTLSTTALQLTGFDQEAFEKERKEANEKLMKQIYEVKDEPGMEDSDDESLG